MGELLLPGLVPGLAAQPSSSPTLAAPVDFKTSPSNAYFPRSKDPHAAEMLLKDELLTGKSTFCFNLFFTWKISDSKISLWILAHTRF